MEPNGFVIFLRGRGGGSGPPVPPLDTRMFLSYQHVNIGNEFRLFYRS